MKLLDALIKVNILLMNYVSDKSDNYVIKIFSFVLVENEDIF